MKIDGVVVNSLLFGLHQHLLQKEILDANKENVQAIVCWGTSGRIFHVAGTFEAICWDRAWGARGWPGDWVGYLTHIRPNDGTIERKPPRVYFYMIYSRVLFIVKVRIAEVNMRVFLANAEFLVVRELILFTFKLK